MDEIAALTSFIATFVMAMPLFIIAWIMLRRVRRRAERTGERGGNPGFAMTAAVCVIETLIILAAFPLALYLVSGGEGRGEASAIVSSLFLLPLGVIAAAGAAVTLVRISRRAKEDSPRPED